MLELGPAPADGDQIVRKYLRLFSCGSNARMSESYYVAKVIQLWANIGGKVATSGLAPA